MWADQIGCPPALAELVLSSIKICKFGHGHRNISKKKTRCVNWLISGGGDVKIFVPFSLPARKFYTLPTRHGYDSKYFFFSNQLLSESFDSTQLMTHDVFTRINSNQITTQNGFYENWLKSTHDSKELSRILIQIISWLTDSNQPLISLTFDSTLSHTHVCFPLTFFSSMIQIVFRAGLYIIRFMPVNSIVAKREKELTRSSQEWHQRFNHSIDSLNISTHSFQ